MPSFPGLASLLPCAVAAPTLLFPYYPSGMIATTKTQSSDHLSFLIQALVTGSGGLQLLPHCCPHWLWFQAVSGQLLALLGWWWDKD